ncbi:hypothetical protein KC887_06635 [Candidatus Kaiserbacteria bacterium]|nr:hypothetical protein [Candidatus Kaiserbacteria bacterium]
MKRQFIFGLVATMLATTTAVAQEQEMEDGEVVTYYGYDRVVRCDGVVMENQFPEGDRLSGILSVLTPDGASIIYGAFDDGAVVEFGFLNAEPVYVEDMHFDFYDWVNIQLKARGYAPWTEESIHVSCEQI